MAEEALAPELTASESPPPPPPPPPPPMPRPPIAAAAGGFDDEYGEEVRSSCCCVLKTPGPATPAAAEGSAPSAAQSPRKSTTIALVLSRDPFRSAVAVSSSEHPCKRENDERIRRDILAPERGRL